jgi:GNAT superfamily N-acetyltransferase
MIVRPFEPSDLAAVLPLWERLMANGRAADARFELAPGASDAMRAWIRERWAARVPWPACWVAEADRMIGFVTLFVAPSSPVIAAPLTGIIGDVWVEADWRDVGLGRRLVEQAVAGARAAGCARFEVGTLANDEVAVGFWRHLGFGPWRITLAAEAASLAAEGLPVAPR